MDKCAVCVKNEHKVLGICQLKQTDKWKICENNILFSQSDEFTSCKVINGKSVNLGDGDGMQVPCKFYLLELRVYKYITGKFTTLASSNRMQVFRILDHNSLFCESATMDGCANNVKTADRLQLRGLVTSSSSKLISKVMKHDKNNSRVQHHWYKSYNKYY